MTPELAVNDLRAHRTHAGGFTFVHLRDVDDGDTYLLDEDEIVALHEYLGRVIAEQKLDYLRTPRE